MSAEIIIRPKRAADGIGIARIFESLSVVEGTSRVPYLPASFWENLYEQRSDQAAILVAEIDSKVVGHLGLIADARPRRRHVGSFGLAVHAEYQARGAGAALMKEMLDVADNWFGLLRVELDVFAHNTHAIQLYERFGFQEEGRSRRDTLVAGKLADAVTMARMHPDESRFSGLI